jgi:hypothetical protein
LAAKVDGVLEALVNHATRHGGDVTEILDAWATYQGEPTAAERTEEANEEAAKAHDEGTAANRKQVEEAADKASKASEKEGK